MDAVGDSEPGPREEGRGAEEEEKGKDGDLHRRIELRIG
jgi:hypothetical protein